jgi:hypothetical protein
LVLEDVDLHLLSRAYDRAWLRFLRTGMLTPQNLSQSREILAKNILAAAREGARDEWTVARDAFMALVASDLPGTPASFHRSPIKRLAERRRHNRGPRRLARRRG